MMTTSDSDGCTNDLLGSCQWNFQKRLEFRYKFSSTDKYVKPNNKVFYQTDIVATPHALHFRLLPHDFTHIPYNQIED